MTLTESPAAQEITTPSTPSELSSSRFDAEGLERWLDHLEADTHVTEVIPKRIASRPSGMAPRSSLADARQMLLRRTVLAIQIRYHEAGAEWREILMVIGSRYRSDRIRLN